MFRPLRTQCNCHLDPVLGRYVHWYIVNIHSNFLISTSFLAFRRSITVVHDSSALNSEYVQLTWCIYTYAENIFHESNQIKPSQITSRHFEVPILMRQPVLVSVGANSHLMTSNLTTSLYIGVFKVQMFAMLQLDMCLWDSNTETPLRPKFVNLRTKAKATRLWWLSL